MKFTAEGPMAIPLWINGRPYLSMGEQFFDVVNPHSGEAVRRVPLCGASEVDAAVNAARLALDIWAAQPLSARQRLVAALADALEGLTAHFARLLGEECGMDAAAAEQEVQAAVGALRAGALGINGGRVMAVVVDDRQPLSGLAALIAPALLAGACIVCKPSPKAPGAAFALCELSSRAGWPAGVLNLVQGDTAAVRALCAHPEIAEVAFAGGPALAAQLRGMVEHAGKVFSQREAA